MNAVERVIRRVDGWQQRHKATAFGYAVTKKYGDDNAGQLVTGLAHTAFVSLFPLLLVLTTILGLVASFDPSLHREVITAVSHQFPLIGNQLTGHAAATAPVQRDRADHRLARDSLGRHRPSPERHVHDGPGMEHTWTRTSWLPAATRSHRACSSSCLASPC